MFTLAIQVSGHDHHLLEPNIALLRHLGGLERHNAVFLPTKEVSGHIANAYDGLKTVMNDVRVIPMNETPTGGWPIACNKQYAFTVQTMMNCGTPWIMWELDCWARLEGWIDALATEYNQIRREKPFMGMIEKIRYTEGSTVKPFGETCLVGACAIYPEGFGKPGKPYGFNWKFAPAQVNPPIAYDTYQAGELRKFSHKTELMQHMWGTVNYRRNAAGELVCSPKEDNPPGTDHSGTVRPTAAIIHGCKDDSLAKLIMSEGRAERAQFKRDPEPVHFGGPIAAQQSIYAFKVRPGAQDFKMEGDWDSMAKRPLPPPDDQSSDPNGTVGEPQAGDSVAPTDGNASPSLTPHETKGSEDSTVTKILALLEKKNMKVKDVATVLQVPDQKEFEKFLLENGFTFSGVAKWLKPPQLQTA
jgi:hypothetical protein